MIMKHVFVVIVIRRQILRKPTFSEAADNILLLDQMMGLFLFGTE
ncbi:hypothetical protein X975_24203, partial [Stegodyphus mimosarum]